ncbi:annexin A3-like [Olea europaea var. sylvestris]|uniref:annexin A3-like n=1 Tax=Olea europaea var. sylvestris TaxID=158386 RepID=UPI000C1D4031|nr:annexin A3-like [Olea europaea var. sylvestris]
MSIFCVFFDGYIVPYNLYNKNDLLMDLFAEYFVNRSTISLHLFNLSKSVRTCAEPRKIKKIESDTHQRLLLALLGTDEKIFICIFSKISRPRLATIFSSYHSKHGGSLKKAIKSETSGRFKFALLTILKCAENPGKYFAKVLHKVMKGMGTDDTTLTRVIVTRADIDMQYIKVEYEKKHEKSLIDAIHSETSSHYRTFLLSLYWTEATQLDKPALFYELFLYKTRSSTMELLGLAAAIHFLLGFENADGVGGVAYFRRWRYDDLSKLSLEKKGLMGF